MEERKLKLWEIIKGCEEGSWIEGDTFISSERVILFYGEGLIGLDGCKLDSEFVYGGNFKDESN